MRLISLAFPLLLLVNTSYAQIKVDTASANDNYHIANAFLVKRQFDSAMLYFNKALSRYKDSNNWEKQASCYTKLADCYGWLSDFETSITNGNLALEIINKKRDKLNVTKAEALLVLGRSYRSTGKYDKALALFLEALPILKVVYSETHQEVASCYRQIAVIYNYTGDFEKSKAYSLQALNIFKKTANNNLDIGSIYFTLGQVYISLARYDSAEILANKAIHHYKLSPGNNNYYLAFGYTLIGDSYRYRGKYPQALTNYQKALSLSGEAVDSQVAILYRNCGSVQAFMGNYALAIKNFEKSLAMGKRILGGKHPAVASIYFSIANSYKLTGELDKALEYIQGSLIANFVSFHDPDPYSFPTDREYLDRGEAFLSLKKKAEILIDKYNLNKDVPSLLASYNSYKLMDLLITEARREVKGQRDKIQLGRIATETKIYENIIKVSLQLYAVTGNRQYYEAAFLFSERNKASVLTEALSDITARGIGLVPGEVLAMEKNLKKKRSELKTAIGQLKHKQSDLEKVTDLEKELFELDLSFDSLITRMEEQYPKYYELKYKDRIIDVPVIQRNLAEGMSVLEYFEGADSLYAFVITPEIYKVISIPADSMYRNLMAQFKECMRKAGTLEAGPEEEYSRFIIAAHQLYTLLLKQPFELMNETDSIQQVVIIPDGQLSYLPFDLLLEKPGEKEGDYSALNYVINKYTISYAYSASLVFLKDGPVQRNGLGYKCISFAPQYAGENRDSIDAIALGKFRNAVTPLKWNQREVTTLHEKISGDYYLADMASEDIFKKKAPEYDMIHLAMHALADSDDPMNSKLVFKKNAMEGEISEDGYLHAFELYNMELHARLVVLSACNTGDGEWAKGEGIMSLARAFAFAGVPSAVMTHWKVDDEVTSILMEHFYENVSQGMNISKALRDAKLSYIRKAEPAKLHPFYWGAFAVIGKDDPVIPATSSQTVFIVVGIGVATILLTGLFVGRRFIRN